MKRSKIIDTLDSEEQMMKKEKQRIKNTLVDLMIEFQATFSDMQEQCDQIKGHLSALVAKSNKKLHKSSKKSKSLNELKSTALTTQDLNKIITVGEDIPANSLKKKSGNDILKQFIPIKKKVDPAKPVPKVSAMLFKLKLLKIYSKAISCTLKFIKPRKTLSDLDLQHETRFYENCIKNEEEVMKIRELIKARCKKIIIFRNLFKINQIVTKNFSLFLQEFFDCSIEKIIKSFGFKCCEGFEHSDACLQSWHELKDWSFNSLAG